MASGNGTEYEKGQIIYKGSWCQGQREGQGIEYNRSKPGLYYYKGHWKNGLKDGLGRHVIGSEANYYEGYYLNGLRHGNGTLVFPELNYTYVGCWKNNKMDGFGRYKKTNKFGLLQTYEGNFKKNDFNGLVRNIFVDVIVYTNINIIYSGSSACEVK